MKPKACFEMINEIDKHLASLIRKKRKKRQVNKRNERDDITTYSTDIKWKYFEQLHAKTFGNLDEIDKFQSLLKKKWIT